MTGTLHNRVNPTIRFDKYAKDAGLEPFPICEHVAHLFLKNVDSAPSFPRSSIIAVAFSKHVLGLMNVDDILQSCRIKVFVPLHYTKKRKLIRRPQLTVTQISHLEQCVNETGRTANDRVAAGFFLVLTYGRSRISDAMSSSAMELEIHMGSEHGYLGCTDERCKTGTSLGKRTRLSPVVITTMSFTEQGWIQTWLEVRHQAKLETGPGVPLLPNPTSGGGWTKIPVTCEVAGDWLRDILKDIPGADLLEHSNDVESTSSSGDSRDEEEADHRGDEAAVEKFTGAWGDTGVPDNTEYSSTRHRGVCTSLQMKLVTSSCGWMEKLQYTKCAGVPTFMHPSCVGCFRR